MPRHRSLVNRQAVRSKFASEGYRTSREVLDYLDVLVGAAIKAGIRGMAGRGKQAVTVEEVAPGTLLGDPTAPSKGPGHAPSRWQVTRGLLRR